MFAIRIKEDAQSLVARCKPWSSFLDVHALEKPTDAQVALTRSKRNIASFSANYTIVVAACTILSLAFNPSAIAVILLTALACNFAVFDQKRARSFVGRELSETERWGIAAIGSTIVVFGLTDAGAVLILGATLGVTLVCFHSSFHNSNDFFDMSEL